MVLAYSHHKLRLLFLLPFAPRLDAPHGGGRVMAQLLVRLAERHHVALLYLSAADEPRLDDVLQRQCDLTEEIIRPRISRSARRLWAWRLHLIQSLLKGKPIWATEWAVPEYGRRVERIVRAWQPDLVQIDYHIMAQYLSALDGCDAPRVLVEYEPGIKAAPYLQQSYPIVRRVMHCLDTMAWKRFEPAITRKVQAVVVFTDEDRQALSQFRSLTPIVKIPLGTELSQQPLNPLGHQPLSLLFIGNFTHPPNIDAASRLIDSIFPHVRVQCQHVALYIVGSQPPELWKTKCESIIVTDYVQDVTPYLDRAAVVVVPLRLGGGMRVKVLEALAAGKAVVASSLAIAGLDVKDGQEVVLAESDEEFCRAIIQLLSNPMQRASLAGNARAWAQDHLSWDQSVAAYERLYARLLR